MMHRQFARLSVKQQAKIKTMAEVLNVPTATLWRVLDLHMPSLHALIPPTDGDLHIRNGWRLDDVECSGLRLSVIGGGSPAPDALVLLHIEVVTHPTIRTRDLFFTGQGDYDGDGTALTLGR